MRRYAALALVVAAVWTSAPGAAAAPAPAVTVTPSSAAPGEYVRVRGTGWGSPGASVIDAVICGNQALDQSADCAIGYTATSVVGADGTIATSVLVEPPPTPCPCVVRVADSRGGDAVVVPLVIPGVRVAPPRANDAVQRVVALSHVWLEGHNGWTSWFGASAHRTLRFTVTNIGNVALHDPQVDVTVGRGRTPTGFVQPPAGIDLAPRQSVTVEVPVTFPSLGFGTYTVAVTVDPVGVSASTVTRNFVLPWALLAAAVAAVQVLLLRLRNRARRRLVSTPVQPDPEPAVVGA